MIEKTNGKLEYQRLTEEEKAKRHILGVLMGPCASVIKPTRNKHLYDNDTWENVFNDPIVREQFENGGIFGEAGHPSDRDETEIEKIAIVMPEAPKKDAQGRLIGIWHILDTPCGRILKTLCDYGYKIGISSRGNGDSIDEDENGVERVDPDSYTLHAFDAVIVPALEDARLTMVEGLKTKKTLSESLNAVIEKESDETNKQAMKESLANLNVVLTSNVTGDKTTVTVPVEVNDDGEGNLTINTPSADSSEEMPQNEVTISTEVIDTAQEKADNEEKEDTPDDNDEVIQAEPEDGEGAGDAGNSILQDLQDALKSKQEVQKINEGLQERLSAGCAREQALTETLGDYRTRIAELVEQQKVIIGLRARAAKLESDCTHLEEALDRATKSSNLLKLNISKLEQLGTRASSEATKWHESLEASAKTCGELRKQIKALAKENQSIKAQAEKARETLTESFDSKSKQTSRMNEQLTKDNKVLKTKVSALSKAYAESICDAYGIDSKQIINRLTDYTPEEIDRLVESFQQRKSVSRALPFRESDVKNISYVSPRRETMGDDSQVDADAADAETVRLFANLLSEKQ